MTARAFMTVLGHDIASFNRGRSATAQAALFFALLVAMAVFGLGSVAGTDAQMLTALMLLAMMLAAIPNIGDMLEKDRATGQLDDMVLSTFPLPALMAARAAAHMVAVTLPLAFAAPLLLQVLAGDNAPSLVLGWAVMLPCAASFSMTALLGAALTLGARNAAALIAVLVLPLLCPAVIFAAGALNAELPRAPLTFLWAFAVAATTLVPFAAAAIVKSRACS